MSPPLAVVVLAAGLGKRTKVPFPKVLLPLCGRTLLDTVLGTVAALHPERTVVVLHHGREQVERSLQGHPGITTIDQGAPLGTGHAVKVAMTALPGFAGDVLVVYGDAPLISIATLERLRAARAEGVASLLTAVVDDPSGLGRVLRDDQGELIGVREERDCNAVERELDEINAGFYCFDAARLPAALAALQANNVQGEYYLTDTVGWLLERGQRVVAVPAADPEEVEAVNSLAELAGVRAALQERILLHHLANGVIIDDPSTTFIDQEVEIGAGTRLLPCTVIQSGVKIGAGCEVGPFSHLRPGTVLEDGAEVGNFVECKKARLGRGTKAKHLSYLGDATIGVKANIGAGTVIANYDGLHKHHTTIGDGAFVGSGTVLVAPSTVGEGAMTGAGAIVTRNSEIGAGEIWVGVPARRLRRRTDQERTR